MFGGTITYAASAPANALIMALASITLTLFDPELATYARRPAASTLTAYGCRCTPMVAATTSALAPGYRVLTWMVGGTISGYWATGSP